jgi:uncharacterized protein
MMAGMGRLVAFVGFLLVCSTGQAALAQTPEAVRRDGSFVDTTGTFGADDERILEAALAAVREQSSIDVAVLVDQGRGRSVRSVAEEVVEAWFVGGENDRGVLVYVQLGSRDIRIEVGEPVQRRLGPTEAQAILDAEILPRFSDDRIVAGVAAGVRAVGAELGADELGLDDLAGGADGGADTGQLALVVGGGALVGMVLLAKRIGGRSGGLGGSSSDDHASSYSSYSSDDSSSSSSSSSDSGGASGSW